MSHWEIILVAALLSYLLRTVPVLVFRYVQVRENGAVYRFLNYAAFSVMGGIIYSALFGTTYYDNWQGHLQPVSLLGILALVLAAVLAARLRAVFTTLAICLSGYAAILFFI